VAVAKDKIGGKTAEEMAAEFRKHARECLKLARSAQNEQQRDQFLKLAESWESLASEREKMKRLE